MNEYRQVIKRARNKLIKARKLLPKEIIFIEGGFREENTLELYLVPKNGKIPAPNPTLPSPQFMKKGEEKKRR